MYVRLRYNLNVGDKSEENENVIFRTKITRLTRLSSSLTEAFEEVIFKGRFHFTFTKVNKLAAISLKKCLT